MEAITCTDSLSTYMAPFDKLVVRKSFFQSLSYRLPNAVNSPSQVVKTFGNFAGPRLKALLHLVTHILAVLLHPGQLSINISQLGDSIVCFSCALVPASLSTDCWICNSLSKFSLFPFGMHWGTINRAGCQGIRP